MENDDDVVTDVGGVRSERCKTKERCTQLARIAPRLIKSGVGAACPFSALDTASSPIFMLECIF